MPSPPNDATNRPRGRLLKVSEVAMLNVDRGTIYLRMPPKRSRPSSWVAGRRASASRRTN
jgi:hypothetical protein